MCQKAACRACVRHETPRLICAACVERKAVIGYEFRSRGTIRGWPLLHVCVGMDAVTLRPRIAKGIIAIGNIAVGGIAVGGVAVGLCALGGLGLGLLLAVGGAAVGLGLSIGGLAVGSVAIGGLAIGLAYAMGGGAFAPSVIDGLRCDETARSYFERLIGGGLPPSCR